MRHAVILAHPDPHSFNAAVAAAYVAATREIGHEATLRDLYRLDFDPRLGASELPWHDPFAPGADALAERAILADADVIVFVYPLWFNAPPAMLKGYVERVLGMGFGYAAAAPGTRPLLAGKQLVSVSTSGAPGAWAEQTGALAHLRAGFDDHLAAVCGLTVRDHLHLGGVTPGIRDDSVEAMLDEVRDLAGRLFGRPPRISP
jgi:NAD(P)H dehydrogenase (quinone)